MWIEQKNISQEANIAISLSYCHSGWELPSNIYKGSVLSGEDTILLSLITIHVGT